MPILTKHTCIICGGSFNSRSKVKYYCPRCLRNGNYERYSKEQAALGNEIPPVTVNNTYEVTCKHCGKTIIAVRPRTEYCKDCYPMVINMRCNYTYYCKKRDLEYLTMEEFKNYIPSLFEKYPDGDASGEQVYELVTGRVYEKKVREDGMKRLIDFCKKAKESGQSYGMYVSDRTYVKTCRICGEDFYTENSEETVCKECKKIFVNVNAV